MANIYQCPICNEKVKKYTKGAKFFLCCNTRHKINSENWLNKPKSNSPKDEEAAKPQTSEEVSKAPIEKSNESESPNGEARSKAGESPQFDNVGSVSQQVIKKEVETPKSTPQIQEVNGGKARTLKEETDVTPQTSTLEVSGTYEEEPEKVAEIGSKQEETRNICGDCGAIVDSSLICKCGADYNG